MQIHSLKLIHIHKDIISHDLIAHEQEQVLTLEKVIKKTTLLLIKVPVPVSEKTVYCGTMTTTLRPYIPFSLQQCHFHT